MKRLAAIVIALLASAAPAKVVIASDSTAAIYAPDRFPQMGWGMFLRCSLGGVEVVNLARGGRSTKSFAAEGLWASLLAGLAPGDTVLIQFGHNDEDVKKPERFTPPADYARNLTRFVADVRAAGAQPVLLTPVARAKFTAGRIAETHAPYAAAVRTVAAATKTPLIDLDAASMAFLDAKGETAAVRYFMIYAPGEVATLPGGIRDTTHLNERGARAVAAIVARDLGALRLPVSASVVPAASDAATGKADCR